MNTVAYHRSTPLAVKVPAMGKGGLLRVTAYKIPMGRVVQSWIKISQGCAKYPLRQGCCRRKLVFLSFKLSRIQS